MAGKMCPNPKCGKATFFESPTGRKCSKCNTTMINSINSGKGGKGRKCSNCGKSTVFNNKCSSCMAIYNFSKQGGG
jgi:hypothetical protein